MSDIATKLQYLNTTEGKIKDVINMTGANITSDTTFRNYATKLYDGYINVLKDKNTLLDNMPKGTSTGTITDAADLPVYEDKMSKESTQETTIGKNKFDKDNVDWYRNNDTRYDSVGNSNSIRICTTGFSLQGGKTYIISGIPENINFLAIRTYNIPSGNSTDEATRNGMIFSIPENINYVRLLFGGTNFTDETNTLMKNANIQIEEGSTATSYEPYTGGQPSPNPDYPQEVKTVKGYRNLFDKSTLVPQKSIDSSTGEIINFAGTGASEEYISVEPNKTYNLSTSRNVHVLRVSEYASDKSHIRRVQSNTGTNYFTFTVSSNCYFIRISFSYDGNEMTQEKINNVNFMLNEGTEELPYVPYGTNYVAITNTNGTDTNYYTIPLNGNEIAGIGDYKDELIVDKNGHCWLNKKIGKKIFNDSDTFAEQYSSSSRTGFRIIIEDIKPISSGNETPNLLSTKFISVSMNTPWANGKMSMVTYSSNTNNVYFFLEANKTTTDIHNVLDGEPLYYVLATSQLIDLNYTVDLTLFKSINNISNSEDMDMEIKYIKESYE